MKEFPQPDEASAAASLRLTAEICEKIKEKHGFISFAEYMHLALYAAEDGYYTSPNRKFGSAGDFTTAPQMTPLFGAVLARVFAEILPQTAGTIYEFGAGSGILAADIVQRLPENTWRQYCVWETSPDLRARQRALWTEKLGAAAEKIVHCDTLPETFDGVVFGNEVLDALACEVVEWRDSGICQIGVSRTGGALQEAARPLPATLQAALPEDFAPQNLPYRSEIHPQTTAFVRTLAEKLTRGAMLWIDYGFDERSYYHPQRSQGTLIGHYRHRTVYDPFFLPGLVDLTAHVNFSAVAAAAVSAGLDFIGYTTQKDFLINGGLLDLLRDTGDPRGTDYIRAAAACQKLIQPHEMGELFKVIAFGSGIDPDWQSFARGDLSRML